MKINICFITALFTLATITMASGQPIGLENTVQLALKNENIARYDFLTNSLIKSYNESDVSIKDSIANISTLLITARIRKYLEAKKATGEPISDNLTDFSWDYVVKDAEWVTISMPCGVDQVKLKFDNKTKYFKSTKCGKIAVPKNTFKIEGYQNDKFVLYMDASGILQRIIDASEEVEQASQIVVTTRPEGADVFFNDKKFYSASNFEAVQDPGEWRVVIQKAGYKDYSTTVVLVKGKRVVIDQTLEKE